MISSLLLTSSSAWPTYLPSNWAFCAGTRVTTRPESRCWKRSISNWPRVSLTIEQQQILADSATYHAQQAGVRSREDVPLENVVALLDEINRYRTD